ncbi:MAG: peptidoglycan endopeptidase [Verrucomicrobiota bacterium]
MTPRIILLLTTAAALSGGLVSCSSQTKARGVVKYEFEHGRTALLRDGVAYAPRKAPPEVIRAIAAGNRLQDMPYKWGGGHARQEDSGYDCSGTVSYVLREAGLMDGSMPSRGFFGYGKKGYGKWITVYTRKGHVFMTIAGLRLDTGGSHGRTGPRWKPQPRPAKGHVVRHPRGL